MKRGISRDRSPSSKLSRSSLGRYDDSSDDEGIRRTSRGPGSPSRRYLPPEPRLDREEYPRPPPPRTLPPPVYKTLCVSNLHSKANDEMVKDALNREFKRFGDATVRVTLDSEEERVAYVYFRSFEEAREAKYSKPRILFYDKPVIVEPVYEPPKEYLVRGKSRSPPYDYERYRPRSPPYGHPMDIDDPYERYERRLRIPYPYDYYLDGPPPSREEFYRSRSYGYMPPLPRGYKPYLPPGRGPYDFKRDKFPNYLHHVQPEDDPLATRTLFVGNLEINITEEELRRIFSRYGQADDVDIKRPPPGTGNAYAFVRYKNLDMAHRAKLELSGQYIGKFQCKIGYGKALPTTRVWVGGLGPWTSLAQLTQEFDRFGAIKKIEYEKGDMSAYILYESIDAAQAAVKEMRGFPLGGSDKKLRTDFAEAPPIQGAPFATNSGIERDEREPQRRNYDDYGGEFSGGYQRGRGRGRGWYERGRGRGYHHQDHYHRNNYHNNYEQGNNSGYNEKRNNENQNNTSNGGISNVESIADLAKAISVAWEGSMVLKNSTFAAKIYVVEGDSNISELLKDEKGLSLLKITQRLRLDQPRLDDVSRRISSPSNATILIALPNSSSSEEQAGQSRPLRNLVAYLKQKEAAGVVSLNSSSGGVLYAFPPCPFSLDLLHRAAPNLNVDKSKDDHLVFVIDRGSTV